MNRDGYLARCGLAIPDREQRCEVKNIADVDGRIGADPGHAPHGVLGQNSPRREFDDVEGLVVDRKREAKIGFDRHGVLLQRQAFPITDECSACARPLRHANSGLEIRHV